MLFNGLNSSVHLQYLIILALYGIKHDKMSRLHHIISRFTQKALVPKHVIKLALVGFPGILIRNPLCPECSKSMVGEMIV